MIEIQYDMTISYRHHVRHNFETLLQGLSITGTHIRYPHDISHKLCNVKWLPRQTDYFFHYRSCPLITFSYLLSPQACHYSQACLKGLFGLNLVCIFSYSHTVRENVIYHYAVLSELWISNIFSIWQYFVWILQESVTVKNSHFIMSLTTLLENCKTLVFLR